MSGVRCRSTNGTPVGGTPPPARANGARANGACANGARANGTGDSRGKRAGRAAGLAWVYIIDIVESGADPSLVLVPPSFRASMHDGLQRGVVEGCIRPEYCRGCCC